MANVKYLPRGMKGLIRGIRTVFRSRPDAIYANSFFSPRFSIVFQILNKVNRYSVLVIAPRGELDPGALAQKAVKKRAYIALSRALGITQNAIWHASSTLELKNIEMALGHKVRSIVRENDTLLPEQALPAKEPGNTLSLVSLSRISRKKNIHVLLIALCAVREVVSLDIIGPAEDESYFAECQEIVQRLPPNIHVRFVGSIEAPLIVDRLNGYDLMVCPTSGENFGHVIAESLAAACPVMCADVTPWTKTLRTGGGVIVDTHDHIGWAQSITEYSQGGAAFWRERREESRRAYSAWTAGRTEPHFFDLLENEIL
ncbi:glycosyltransferase [Paeniglutamicibacter gangotriensis]|nr:glycosyltransferase [Paeniglutamicibacter gangotriensis]